MCFRTTFPYNSRNFQDISLKLAVFEIILAILFNGIVRFKSFTLRLGISPEIDRSHSFILLPAGILPDPTQTSETRLKGSLTQYLRLPLTIQFLHLVVGEPPHLGVGDACFF